MDHRCHICRSLLWHRLRDLGQGRHFRHNKCGKYHGFSHIRHRNRQYLVVHGHRYCRLRRGRLLGERGTFNPCCLFRSCPSSLGNFVGDFYKVNLTNFGDDPLVEVAERLRLPGKVYAAGNSDSSNSQVTAGWCKHYSAKVKVDTAAAGNSAAGTAAGNSAGTPLENLDEVYTDHCHYCRKTCHDHELSAGTFRGGPPPWFSRSYLRRPTSHT